MTSQYIASVPSDGSIPSEIVEYFSKFYEISDSPANHEKYADMFTADGTIIMASNRVQGREGKVFSLSFFDSSSFFFLSNHHTAIIKLRHGMWEKVAKRSHVPKQLFGLGKGSSEEVMLYGTVDYTLKDGRGTTVDWSARAHFVKKEGEQLKMDFYQVYLVSVFFFFFPSSSGKVKADFFVCRILRPWRMLSKKVLSHLYDNLETN